MSKSHVESDNAWGGTRPQMDPGQLKGMRESVALRGEDVDAEEFHAALERLRRKIDSIDDEVMRMLSRRMKIAEQIGRYKKDNNVTILQIARWNQMIERALGNWSEVGLSREFITRYFDAVHTESINHQKKVMGGAP